MTKVLLLLVTLLLAPALYAAGNQEVSVLGKRCVGAECTQAAPAPNKNILNYLGSTPVQLILAGVLLIAVRILAKK